MAEEKRFLVDVGMNGVPFPIRVVSKSDPKGQQTIANISINARIMHEFEARWIDKFVQILHMHRDYIGADTLRANITDYLAELNAKTVRVDFDYPFFIEKLTPSSAEKCLVRYSCTYSAKISSVDGKPRVFLRVDVPAISTYPGCTADDPGGLFGQLSMVSIEVESLKDIYVEDLVDMVDKHALLPVYSFLTEKDQKFVIAKIHSERKSSVVMTDEIKDELAYRKDIVWYSVKCSNFGMLHSYSTIIATEKSMWVPFSGADDLEL